MTTFNPLTHPLMFLTNTGGITDFKTFQSKTQTIWAMDAILSSLSSAGLLDIVIQDNEPTGTVGRKQIWVDPAADPTTAASAVKIYNTVTQLWEPASLERLVGLFGTIGNFTDVGTNGATLNQLENDSVPAGSLGVLTVDTLSSLLTGRNGNQAVGLGVNSFPNNFSVAVGHGAGENSTGASSVIVGTGAGASNIGSGAVIIGNLAGDNNVGTNAVIIGRIAGRNNTAQNIVAVGDAAGDANTGENLVVVGFDTGRNNTGDNVTAIGNASARNNTGSDVVALGQGSCVSNSGNDVSAIGIDAGRNNTGASSIMVGQNAGLNNTGSDVVAIGSSAASSSSGDNVVAIGRRAGSDNTSSVMVAIGSGAGEFSDTTLGVHVGAGAAKTATGNRNVTIGSSSGSDIGGAGSVAVGSDTSRYTLGDYNVAIGSSALTSASSEVSNTVAIGRLSGRYAEGSDNVYIGSTSGPTVFSDGVTYSSTVDVTNNQFNIGTHGFAVGSVKIMKIGGTVEPGGTQIGSINAFKVVSDTVVEILNVDLTSVGTAVTLITNGANNINYSNTVGLGNNAKPNRSNQVMLGDNAVGDVYTEGVYRTKVYAPGTLPSANLDRQGSFCYMVNGTGTGQNKCMVYCDGVNWRKTENGEIQA